MKLYVPVGEERHYESNQTLNKKTTVLSDKYYDFADYLSVVLFLKKCLTLSTLILANIFISLKFIEFLLFLLKYFLLLTCLFKSLILRMF